MTISDVIRHNVRYYRDEIRGWSQRELAERLEFTTGEAWTQFRVSDIEGGRRGRDRTISPEELLALARELDVSIIELMTPPSVVRIGDDRGSQVKVRLGTDIVSPDLFFRLAFMLPAKYRERLGEQVYPEHLEWENKILMAAVQAIVNNDPNLSERYGQVRDLSLDDLVELNTREDVQVAVGEWIIEQYGVEVFRSLLSSPRAAARYGNVLGDEAGGDGGGDQ